MALNYTFWGQNRILQALAENIPPATMPEVEASISFNVANGAVNGENKVKVKELNTSHLTDSYISFTLKLESLQKF